ncbi:MAG: Fmu (Sun) domain-containing protein [Chitinophagaceae bacterium]|nr:Fmu (Sun) domain-containing protein [Chitinophagaceae bacterium]
MNHFHSYINTARQVLSLYRGEEPLASFLKRFYSSNKKYGSKDRKQISHFCYCYFRIGKLSISSEADERILLGLFLCSSQSQEILAFLRPEWNDRVTLAAGEKLDYLGLSASEIFPFADTLSEGVDSDAFRLSHLQQPDLFLRVRPGHEEKVAHKLNSAGIAFRMIRPDCLALPNGSSIDSVVELNREAVVQDLSSQQVLHSLKEPPVDATLIADTTLSVWDCCAASGGKSIMLFDIFRTLRLTVSDIRESILINLRKRFREAGIRSYTSFVADLTQPGHQLPKGKFNIVLADVPCSGSGTWARTPEQLYFYDEEKTKSYADLQEKITMNILDHVEPGGLLLYITCSVFKKENEDRVSSLQSQAGFELLSNGIIAGYDRKADTMYAALLRRVLGQ